MLLESLPGHAEHYRAAAIGSAIFHAVLILVLISVPRELMEAPEKPEPVHRVTHLVDPPTPLTQRAPNRRPLSQEISAGMVAPSVRPAKPIVRTQAPPAANRAAKTPKASPALAQEPPKIAASQPPPSIQILPPTAAAPPSKTSENPKLTLQSLPPPPSTGNGTGVLKNPGGGVQEAIRELAHQGVTSTRSVGDDTAPTVTPDFNPTPSPTRPKSSLELLSDPKGVDFRPYLLQVLQNVRRNWFAVMPESARLGQRGRVVVQFAIGRDGKILKVTFATESGVHSFDRAAVAALSASDPLPQLPPEFKGERVVLQFTFLYNAPK